MFGGEEETIRLQFDSSLIGVVLDRFGKDAAVRKADENSFILHIDAFISPTLLGWIFDFGGKVKILGPESLIERFKQNINESLTKYTHEK